MSDQDPDLKGRFDQLAADVSDSVDTEDRLQQLHQRRSRPRPRVALSLAAAAVVLFGLVGGLVLINDRATTVEAGTDQQPADPVASKSDSAACGTAAYLIYLRPEADLLSADRAADGLPGIVARRFRGSDETYAEFSELFADQPDFVVAAMHGDLPTSWVVIVDEPWDPGALEAVANIPGYYSVQEVESVDERCVRIEDFTDPFDTEDLRPVPTSEDDLSVATTTTYPPTPSDTSDAQGTPDIVGTLTAFTPLDGDSIRPAWASLGTVEVNAQGPVAVQIDAATVIQGCSGNDGREPVDRSRLADSIGTDVYIWLTPPNPTRTESVAARISIGSCG